MPNTFSRVTPLGKRIEMLGYTLREVSEGAGVDRWHLNDYLFERKMISARHLMRLSTFLKCAPEAIVSSGTPQSRS